MTLRHPEPSFDSRFALAQDRLRRRRISSARQHRISRCFRFAALSVSMTATLLLFLACNREQKQLAMMSTGGDPNRGKEAIERYGCNACHNIPGVPGPKGMVGPPLDHMAARAYIGGKFPNNPQTMIKWLQNPPAFDSQSAMPNLGVTESDSRDITAYLYTLK